MSNITVVTYPDVVYDESRKFLLLAPWEEDLQTFINAIAIMDDPDDYTVYHWDHADPATIHLVDPKNGEWILNTAAQAEKIYINMSHYANEGIISHFLFGWGKSYWSTDFSDAEIELYKKMNKNYVLNPIELLVNI